MGCRTKAAKLALLRVVVVEVQGKASLAPDPAGRLSGRGASVHLDQRCIDLAEKRRAFPRALRLDGPVDVGPVREHLAQHLHDQHLHDQHQHDQHQHDQQPHPPSDESGSIA